MIQKIFGLFDILVSVLLFTNNVQIFGFLTDIIIFLLFVKGLISIFPIPFLYMPCIIMDIVDIVSVFLVAFGDVLLPLTFKIILIIIMLAKSLPSVIMIVFRQ